MTNRLEFYLLLILIRLVDQIFQLTSRHCAEHTKLKSFRGEIGAEGNSSLRGVARENGVCPPSNRPRRETPCKHLPFTVFGQLTICGYRCSD